MSILLTGFGLIVSSLVFGVVIIRSEKARNIIMIHFFGKSEVFTCEVSPKLFLEISFGLGYWKIFIRRIFASLPLLYKALLVVMAVNELRDFAYPAIPRYLFFVMATMLMISAYNVAQDETRSQKAKNVYFVLAVFTWFPMCWGWKPASILEQMPFSVAVANLAWWVQFFNPFVVAILVACLAEAFFKRKEKSKYQELTGSEDVDELLNELEKSESERRTLEENLKILEEDTKRATDTVVVLEDKLDEAIARAEKAEKALAEANRLREEAEEFAALAMETAKKSDVYTHQEIVKDSEEKTSEADAGGDQESKRSEDEGFQDKIQLPKSKWEANNVLKKIISDSNLGPVHGLTKAKASEGFGEFDSIVIALAIYALQNNLKFNTGQEAAREFGNKFGQIFDLVQS